MNPPRRLTDRRGNLALAHRGHDDVPRLNETIRRLERAITAIPTVRAHLDEQLVEVTQAQGQGQGSGISDPTGGQAGRIEPIQAQHRALTRALRSIEDAVEHYRVEAERSLGKNHADPAEKANAKRCPKMVLLNQTVRREHDVVPDTVLIRCDRLTAHKLDDNGQPIGYDPDMLCTEHRAQADEAARHADTEQRRRLRRREPNDAA